MINYVPTTDSLTFRIIRPKGYYDSISVFCYDGATFQTATYNNQTSIVACYFLKPATKYFIVFGTLVMSSNYDFPSTVFDNFAEDSEASEPFTALTSDFFSEIFQFNLER